MNPKNIPLKQFKAFLEERGCKLIRHHKGHLIYAHKDCTRPIVLQDHIDPVPMHVVKNNLRSLGLTLEDLREF